VPFDYGHCFFDTPHKIESTNSYKGTWQHPGRGRAPLYKAAHHNYLSIKHKKKMSFTTSPSRHPSPPLSPPSSSPLYPSSPSSTTSASFGPTLSDLPNVRRLHTTDGYRAGLSAGKEDPVVAQAGFDQGYPVGILLGMRAGNILGTISELVRNGLLEKETVREAEDELSVARLIQDVGARLGSGIVEELENGHDVLPEGAIEGERDIGNASWDDLDMSWIAELASIRKWSRIAEDATNGLGLGLGLSITAENKAQSG